MRNTPSLTNVWRIPPLCFDTTSRCGSLKPRRLSRASATTASGNTPAIGALACTSIGSQGLNTSPLVSAANR